MGSIGNANNIELTEQQKTGIQNRTAELKQLLESQRYAPGFDESNPNHRLFFQAFDGTGNDRDNVPNDGRRTNPDVLQELLDNSTSVSSLYRSGVGTDGGLDKLNYPGGDGSSERTEEAYDLFRGQAQAWHKENPDVDIYVSMAGFSRGASSARHFANLVYERGIPAEDAQANRVLVGHENHGRNMVPVYEITYDKYIIPPGEVRLDTMLLYDAVATGQTQSMKLAVPPVEDLKILHLTANDELRNQFDLQSVIDPKNGFDPRLYEFGLPGAHSDLGGGYADNWLSARYLELGHTFLKQNGVPLRDIPAEHQVSPDAVGVIHDPDKLYYTTFGERQVNYSDNTVLTDAGLVSDQGLQENLVARLAYIDNSYTSMEYALEWARTHPEDPDAVMVLAREAEIERDLARLSDKKAQIFSWPELSLETMAEYNRQFAGLQSEADRRMHEREREYDADISTVRIFTEDGSLTPEFVTTFDTQETVIEFFQANANLQLADAGSDVLQREYAAYVYNKALTEAAASTGRDVAEILELNVPGNPNAEGYYYQPDAELAATVAAQQQSEGVQSSIYGLDDLLRGLDGGDALDIVSGLGRLGLGVDRLQDGFETDSSWLSDEASVSTQAGLSAAAFLDDVLAGDELGAVASGAYLVDHMGAALDESGQWTGLTDHAAVGTGLSALSLYQALDGGNAAAIAGSGFELANTLSQGAVAEQVSGALGISEAAPYGAYVMAGVQLIEGDVEQAGMTALGGYLMSTGNPYLVAAGAVLSVFGGSLFGGGTPKAWADFTVNEDGSIGIEVGSNSNGDGLEQPVSELADALAPVIDQVRTYGVEVKADYLPRIGIKGDEYYFEHGGGTRLITVPAAELQLLTEMTVIGQWMMDNDIDLWSRSGRHVYLGDTDWSHTVRGTGVFAGGGQKQHAPVTIDSKHIVSLNDSTLRTVAQQLAEVTRTWRADKGLFAGEGGALLAVGLGAGLVQYAEVAKGVDALPEPVSVTEHPDTAALIEAAGVDNVIAAGYGVIETGNAAAPTAPAEPDIAYAPFYTGRRASVYDDALQRFDREVADRVELNTPADAATGSLPVFQDGAAADPGEAAARIRALADDGGPGGPPVPGGDDGSGGNGPPEPTEDTGGRAATPVSHFLSMVEDRYLVTSTERLLELDEGAAFVGLGDASNGAALLEADGTIRFTPPADYHGPAGFEYRIRTADGAVETRRVEITVTGRNDRPEARDDALIGVEDETIELDRLLANDSDVDGDPIHIAAVSQVDAGQVEVDPSGAFRYVPGPDYAGEVQLVYITEDPDGARTAARAAVTIEEGENDPPVVPPVLLTGGMEEQAFAFHESELLDGARDPEGGALHIQSIAATGGGAVNWDRDSGDVVFVPEPDFHGLAEIELTVADSQGLTTTATAGIEFENVPDPFTSGNTLLSVDENQVVKFASEDLLPRLDIDNPDGGEVAIVAARMVPGMQGVVDVLPDGSVQWMPPPDYSGQSAFEVRLFNGFERIASRVDLDIVEVNDPPRTRPDRLDAVEDQAFEFNTTALVANDSDPEGDAFGVTGTRRLDPQAGVLSFDPRTGEARLEPAPDFFGEAAIEYTLVDTADGRRADSGAVIAVRSVDDPPQVTDKDLKEAALNLDEDETAVFSKSTLLDTLTNVDGETLSIAAARMLNDAHGEVSVTAGGGVRFEPAADYFGEAPFEIDVSDGNSTVTATMTPMLWPVNDAPRVQDDHAGMDEDTTLVVGGADLLANDVDVDGPFEALRIVGPWATSAGVAYYDAEADELRYTPPADAFGDAWVDYIVEDGDGAFAVARLDVTINNVYDPVWAADDVVVVQEDTDHLFEASVLTGNDLNPDQGPLEIVAIDDTGFTHGQLALTADGRVDYQSEANYAGEQSFTYTVEDESGNRSSATVRFVVEDVNDAPRVTRTAVQMLEDHVRVFEVDELLDNAVDIEDDWMQVVAARSHHGTVDFDAFAGEIIFTPIEHLNTDLNGGPLVFEYLVRDEKGAGTWGAVDLDVEPVNDPPQAGDDLLLAWESGLGGYVNPVAEGDLLANDIEVDGEAIRIDQVIQGANGTVTLDTANRTLSYLADPGFTGQDTFTYRVTDDVIEANGTLSADTGTVTVQVLDNRAPVAHDFATIVPEDTVLDFGIEDFMQHVDDPDLGILELPENHRIIAVNDSVNGQASLEPDGSVRFVPTADYNSVQHGGVASFDYVMEDIVGNRSEATASITYTPVNDDPVAVGDVITQTIFEEQTAFINIADLLANDFDVDDNPGENSVVFDGLVGNRSEHGTIVVQGDQIRYVGDKDYVGSDSFQYRIADGEGGFGTGTVQLDVTNVNDAPLVEFDSAQADDSGANTLGGLLNNDFDADGDTLRIVNPSHGSVVNNGTAIRFHADNRGHDYNMTITYGVTDGQETVQSRVDVHVIHVNRPPTSLTQIQTDSDSVFVAGNDPDTPDPAEEWLGGTVSFMGYSWNAQVGIAAGSGAGQNGLFIDLRNQFSHPVDWPNPTPAVISGTGTFSYTIEVSDGDNEVRFSGSIQTPVSLRNINFIGAPVVIDMNNDGLVLLGPEESGAAFDWTGDGGREATGWIAGEGDAVLAYDHDGDDRVTRADEISFVQYQDGARTDLEGLRAFDSNGDGVFDAGDDQWSKFGLWIDDGDADFQDGELVAMADSGIASLALHADDDGYETNGNTVFGTAEVTYSDGTTGRLGDVGFAVEVDPGDAHTGDHTGDDSPSGTSETEDAGDEETEVDGTASSATRTDVPATDDSSERDDAAAGEDALNDDQVSRDAAGGDAAQADADLPVSEDDTAGIDLPDDEELDRMAGSDNARAATREPEERVAPVDTDAALSDVGAENDEREDSGEVDMAA